MCQKQSGCVLYLSSIFAPFCMTCSINTAFISKHMSIILTQHVDEVKPVEDNEVGMGLHMFLVLLLCS